MTEIIIPTQELTPPSWTPPPRGLGTDSNELLDAQRQSYGRVSEIRSQTNLAEQFKTFRAFIDENLFRDLGEIISEIDNLKTWEPDSYGCPAPNANTIWKAKNWIICLYGLVAFQDWISPNITSGSEGEVVFEWWYGAKKLTIYVSDQSIEYIQVWGADIYNDMSDGDAAPIGTCRKLWLWLKS